MKNKDIIEGSEDIRLVTQLDDGNKIVSKLIEKETGKSIYAILDKDDKILVPFKYNRIVELQNKLFLVDIYTGKSLDSYVGILDQNFNELIKPNKYKYLLPIGNYFAVSESNIFLEKSNTIGLINSLGEQILAFEYSSILPYGTSGTQLLVYKDKDELMGLATVDGQILIEPKYKKIEKLSDFYVMISDNGEWHEVKREHTCVFENKYSKIYYGGKWGVADMNGKIIVPMLFDAITLDSTKKYFEVSKLITIDKKGNRTFEYLKGLFNENGEFVLKNSQSDSEEEIKIPSQYNWGRQLSEDFIEVEKDGKNGVITTDGTEIVSCKYDKIEFLNILDCKWLICSVIIDSNSLTITFESEILNENGNLLSEICVNLRSLRDIGNNLFAIEDNQRKVSIIKETGIPVQRGLDYVSDFYEYNGKKKYAVIKEKEKYGVIDNYGRVLIKPEYSSLTIEKNKFLIERELRNSRGQKIKEWNEEAVIIPEGFSNVRVLDNDLLIAKKDGKFGCINKNGSVIIPFLYNELTNKENLLIANYNDKLGVIDFFNNKIIDFDDKFEKIKIVNDLILFKYKDSLWGIADFTGYIISEPNFEEIERINYFLIKVRQQSSWGLINNRGKELIHWFDGLKEIETKMIDGLIKIQDWDRNFGFLDCLGNVLLSPNYKQIERFESHYFLVAKQIDYYDFHEHRDKSKLLYGILDSSLHEVIPCLFEYIEYDSDLEWFETENGFINENGNEIINNGDINILINNKYHCAELHNDRLIAVVGDCKEKKYCLINLESREILPPIYDQIKFLSSGLFRYYTNGKYGIVDKEGNIIVDNNYDIIFSPKSKEDNYLVMRERKNWSMFDLSNCIVISFPKVSYIGPCLNNLCKFNIGGEFNEVEKRVKGGLWGFMTPQGKQLIEANYDYCYNFSEGIAAVKKEGKWGFINTNNDIIVPLEYEEFVESFKEGEGKLKKDDEIYIFDKEGILIDTLYDSDDDFYDGGFDDFDYDRETYYALGGDDYEAWKERGGDLDRMMEGMGL